MGEGGAGMKILIACEESGKVRQAFRALGHDAFSCDILPSRDDSPFHIQGNVLPLLKKRWDMVIAFPPCTHLACSGARHFAAKRADGRQQAGIDFFMACINANAPRVCVENPVGIMSSEYTKPSQIIQPWQFGYPATKATCLWLKGLPLLTPTKVVEPEFITLKNGKRFSAWFYESGKKNGKARAAFRSETFDGIAQAMANQWSGLK